MRRCTVGGSEGGEVRCEWWGYPDVGWEEVRMGRWVFVFCGVVGGIV